MVFKDTIYQVVMNFSKGIFQIDQSNYKCPLVLLSMPYEVCHVSCMFNRTRYLWGKPFLNVVFCISVL